MEITEKDKEFYDQMQIKFKNLLASSSSNNLNELDVKNFIEGTISEMKIQEIDIQKMIILCANDPNSILKIEQAPQQMESLGPVGQHYKLEESLGPLGQNYQLESDDTPEAVCVFKKL